MAVEVRELIIRAVVDQQKPIPGGGQGQKMRQQEKEELVRECVEEMMKILKREKLR